MPIGDDRVGVQPLPGRGLDAVGGRHQRGQHRERQHEGAQCADEFAPAQDAAQQEHRNHRCGSQVDHPRGGSAANHAQVRQDQERPRQAAQQGAQIVGGIEVGQHPPGVGGPGHPSPLQQRHQQRHFRTDQSADQRRRDTQHPVGVTEVGEGHVQHRRRQAAHDTQRRLHRDEADGRTSQQCFGQQPADAKGRHVARDDQRRRHHATTVEARRKGQQRKLIDDAARGARRHGRQKQGAPTGSDDRLGGRRGRPDGLCHHQVRAAALIPPTASRTTATATAAGWKSSEWMSLRKWPGANNSTATRARPCRATPISP